MDTAFTKTRRRPGAWTSLRVLVAGGRHARPVIRAARYHREGARGARTAGRILKRLRARVISAGSLLIVAALVVAVSPSFRHYLQDMRTRELLVAARLSEPLNITLSDYVSSGGEETPILNAAAETELSEALIPAGSLRTDTQPSAPIPETPSAPVAESEATAAAAVTTTTTRTTTGGAPRATAAPKKTIETLGVMRIPAINVEMPIAEGAGTSELRYALGHHPATPALGEMGYSTVFGHRMYSYGRHFNRLDELVPGDEVFVTVGGVELRYIVNDKLSVLPDEVPSYMTNSTDKARLLLVTCTPVRVATHRLLVFCTLDRDEMND